MTHDGGPVLAQPYDLFLLDLDGVVYIGQRPVPRAVAAIAQLRGLNKALAYVTNNASRSAAQVAAILQTIGVSADPGEVLTSGAAAARYLAGKLPARAQVLVTGSSALADEVSSHGLVPVASADAGPAAVVQGYDAGVGWTQLAEACLAISAGALWVATNLDRTVPSPRGPVLGNGSLVAAIACAVGRNPDVVVGKPEPALYRAAIQKAGAARPMAVGDRLDTDIEAAVRAGVDSLLVLTGVTSAAQLLTAPQEQRPTHVSADLSGLLRPEGETRMPVWDPAGSASRAGGWRAARNRDILVLHGRGRRDDAVRALASAAWAEPGWRHVTPGGGAAEAALVGLGLTWPRTQ